MVAIPATTRAFFGIGARRVRALPPHRLISAAALIAVLVGLGSLTVALRQPELGFHFRQGASPASAPTIRAASSLGKVTGIQGDSGAALRLRSDDLEREPDIPFQDYASFDHFFSRQDALARILRSDAVTLHGENGRSLTLTPRRHRSLASIPLLFWYEILVGTCCWMCGACILAFRRRDRAALYMALSGFSLMICVAAAAVYTTRELALPGATFRLLSLINHWASLLACGTFVAVFWHYPRRLTRVDFGPLWVGIWLLVGVCDNLQVLPLGNYGVQLALLVGGLSGGGLAILQWWINRRDPVQRASLQWFLMSWCVGFGLYLSVVTVPALVGVNNGDFEGYAFGSCLLIAIGLGLGIARYRLFELGVWWLRIAAFLFSGAAFILIDILLTEALHFENEEASIISVSLVGWAYFPLRQWLHGQIYTRMGRAHIGDLPGLLQTSLGQEPESMDRLVPVALKRLYAPLVVRPLEVSPDAITVTDNGLALQVPGIEGFPAWEARWPDQGRRLFSSVDARTMTAVREVMEKIAAYQTAVRRGEEQERARLTQDLHDDIGARLLTMLHRHPGAIERDLRDVLERLRSTVHGLDAKSLSLEECLDEWRAEVAERCDVADAHLQWIQPDRVPHGVPTKTVQIDLARILREAISNALAHARPAQVTVRVSFPGERLRMVVENDGVDAGTVLLPGLGMRNMKTRLDRLGGALDISLNPPMARAVWSVPLPSGCTDPTLTDAPR